MGLNAAGITTAIVAVFISENRHDPSSNAAYIEKTAHLSSNFEDGLPLTFSLRRR